MGLAPIAADECWGLGLSGCISWHGGGDVALAGGLHVCYKPSGPAAAASAPCARLLSLPHRAMHTCIWCSPLDAHPAAKACPLSFAHICVLQAMQEYIELVAQLKAKYAA